MTAAAVQDIRALMLLFERSDWAEMHVRFGAAELYVARGACRSPPTLVPAPDAAAAPAAEVVVSAPHLGTFRRAAAQGATVDEGATVAELELLGERVAVAAGTAGTVAALLAADGDLVEYGQPLARIAPA